MRALREECAGLQDRTVVLQTRRVEDASRILELSLLLEQQAAEAEEAQSAIGATLKRADDDIDAAKCALRLARAEANATRGMLDKQREEAAATVAQVAALKGAVAERDAQLAVLRAETLQLRVESIASPAAGTPLKTPRRLNSLGSALAAGSALRAMSSHKAANGAIVSPVAPLAMQQATGDGTGEATRVRDDVVGAGKEGRRRSSLGAGYPNLAEGQRQVPAGAMVPTEIEEDGDGKDHRHSCGSTAVVEQAAGGCAAEAAVSGTGGHMGLEREALDSLSGGGSPLVGSPGAGEQLVSHWEAVVRNNGSNGEKRLSPEELVEVGLARKQALEEALGGEWKPALAALKQQATVPAAALQAVRAVLLLLGDETGSGSEWRALRRAVNTNRPQFDPNSLFGRMARGGPRAWPCGQRGTRRQ